MKAIVKKIQSYFSWKYMFSQGANKYFENSVTHERKCVKGSGGYSPVNTRWLEKKNNGIYT